MLYFAWPVYPVTWLVFVALVPTLYIEHLISSSDTRKSVFWLWIYSYVNFLVWNALTTYWIYLASLPGALMAIILNALLMTVPILLYHGVKRVVGIRLALLALLSFWLSLEYLHLNWDTAWPWLNLGNVFAMYPEWVQWYEYTGALGGTVWVWVINMLLFMLLVKLSALPKLGVSARVIVPEVVSIVVLLAIPFGISYYLWQQPLPEAPKHAEVAVIQPNIDPYGEKFETNTAQKQLYRLLKLSDSIITPQTVLVAWPETALPRTVPLESMEENSIVKLLQRFLREHPQVHLLTGFTPIEYYRTEAEKTATSRYSENGELWYDVFNSALLIDDELNHLIYHKSKLVPGVELMPYPEIFGFLEYLAIDLGGTTGSLGMSDEAVAFPIDERLNAAPIICYESIFGDYVGDFVERGSNLITIITNDGWWGNTPGYRQHFHFASLRAIETRRAVARSANTGISGFFNAKGEVLAASEWWVPDAMRMTLPLYEGETFYVRTGDYLGRIASYLAVFFLLVALVRWIIGEKLQIIR